MSPDVIHRQRRFLVTYAVVSMSMRAHRVRSILIVAGCALVAALFAYQLRGVDWSIPIVTAEGDDAGWTIALLAAVVTAVIVGVVLVAIRHRSPRRP
jgi:hypothetical protein